MAYKDNINFLISSAYTLSNEDNQIIAQGKLLNLGWSDDHYLDLKKRVREHLRIQQSNRCAFCRLRISRSQFYPHLEHIVPKDRRPEFTFLPINLAWCCQRCNFGKGTNNTLTTPNLPNYPTDSIGFNIVNPYHDHFLQHFDLIEDLILVVKDDSEKGSNTYDFYKLNRIELAEDRAYELKTVFQNLTREEIIEKLILRIPREKDPRIIKLIEYYLEQIPNWIID